VIVKLEQLDSFGNLSLDLNVSTFTTPSKVIMSCNFCTTVMFMYFYLHIIKLCGMHERLKKMNFFVKR
jgi:hypothetical protein